MNIFDFTNSYYTVVLSSYTWGGGSEEGCKCKCLFVLKVPDEDDRRLFDPFMESGLRLSPTAAEAKQKVHGNRNKKRAPPMDWGKKHEIFSNF